MDSNGIKIFISYRRSDSPGHAGRLSDGFRNKYGREQVFKDVTSIRGGVHFPSVIKKAIEDASVMVVTIGPRWRGMRLFRKSRIFDKTDWIRQEIEAALNGKTHILPVLVNGGQMPHKRKLPLSLHFFGDLNAVTVRDSRWEEDIEDVYNEIEQLVKLPPLTLPSRGDEEKVKQKKSSALVPIALLLLAISMVVYFIFKPKLDEEQTKIPHIAGDWRSKIAMVHPRGDTSAKGTGFFVSSNGHVLTLSVPGYSKKDSLFTILMADKKSYEAHEVSRVNLNELPLVLLKTTLKNTPFFQLASRKPEKYLSIEVLGTEGATSNWKRYTARVSSGDSVSVFYDRPEEGWPGMMGAPIVDVSDEVAFGIHMGTGYDSINKNINKKTGQGFLFTKHQIDILINKMRK